MTTQRPIGLAALSVLELGPANQVLCAAEAGFSHVGIRLVPATPTETVYNIIGDTPLLRETEKRLNETGVKVLDVEILRLKPDTRVINFLPVLETGARLKASNVLVAGNDPDLNRTADNFAELCELAYPLGLNINIEPMPWTEIKTVQAGGKLLKLANRKNAGLIIDPIHFDRETNSLDDIQKLPPGSLHYMQFCDATKERPGTTEGLLYQARNYRLCPGEGGLDLIALLRAMPPDLPISIECCNETEAISVSPLARAKKCLLATQKLIAQAFPE